MAPMADGELKRSLGLFDLTTVIMGSMIGSGIFFLPGGMLASLGTTDASGIVHVGGGAWAVMLAWVLGALIALCGGLVFAELGAAFPKAGGQYVFLRDSVGRAWAFLFSWTAFSVVQSGTIAAVAVAMANAVDYLAVHMVGIPGGLPGVAVPAGIITIPKYGVAFLAVAIVWLLTWINYQGVRRAAWVSNVSTVAKVAALLVIALLAFTVGSGAGNFGDVGASFAGVGLGAFGLAVSASLFAYDGFAQATFVAGEVKQPQRVLPRAILLATVGVAAIYLTVTFAYFHVLPLDQVSQAALLGGFPIASEAMALVFGGAAIAVAVAIVVSTFGTTNAYILSSPRIYHAVAKDREFPRPFGHLSRHGTPTYGLVYGAIWACLLTMSGSYLALADLVVFGMYAFYLVTMVGYFILRRRHPEAFTTFRMPLRPIPAVLFAVAAIAVLASYTAKDVALVAAGRPIAFLGSTTGMGILLILSGLVAYAAQRRMPPPEQGRTVQP